LIIERSKILVGPSQKNLNFNKLIKNIKNYQNFHEKSLRSLNKPMSPETVISSSNYNSSNNNPGGVVI